MRIRPYSYSHKPLTYINSLEAELFYISTLPLTLNCTKISYNHSPWSIGVQLHDGDGLYMRALRYTAEISNFARYLKSNPYYNTYGSVDYLDGLLLSLKEQQEANKLTETYNDRLTSVTHRLKVNKIAGYVDHDVAFNLLSAQPIFLDDGKYYYHAAIEPNEPKFYSIQLLTYPMDSTAFSSILDHLLEKQ